MSQIGLVIVLIAFSSWVILSFLARDLINKYKFHLLGIGIILTVLVLYCFAESGKWGQAFLSESGFSKNLLKRTIMKNHHQIKQQMREIANGYS